MQAIGKPHTLLIALLRCSRGMADLFEMMQSTTFMHQLGYGVLEIGVVNMFHELKPLFRQFENAAGEVPGAAAPPANATKSGS